MARLDLTLDKMRFPGIENFNPEFGTKETTGRGVHSVNLSENDMMPFLLQRPVSVVENSSTGDIEADRKLAFETSGVTLTLGRPSYPGCKVTVYGSFSSGTATVAYDKDANDTASVVVGAGERVELEANALRYFEVKAPAMSELVVASGTLSQAKTIPLGYASDAKLAFKVVFPQGHNDATSADSLTLNGIAVVSNQNGTLAPIPHHAMAEGGSTVYKVLDPNTTLEMYYTADYDGNGTPAFVIVGNPLVISSSTYSIYANGYSTQPESITLTMRGGVNILSGSAYKIGNAVHINLSWLADGGLNQAVFCSIPLKYAPKSTIFGSGFSFRKNELHPSRPSRVYVDSLGQIGQNDSSDYSSFHGGDFSISYPLE